MQEGTAPVTGRGRAALGTAWHSPFVVMQSFAQHLGKHLMEREATRKRDCLLSVHTQKTAPFPTCTHESDVVPKLARIQKGPQGGDGHTTQVAYLQEESERVAYHPGCAPVPKTFSSHEH